MAAGTAVAGRGRTPVGCRPAGRGARLAAPLLAALLAAVAACSGPSGATGGRVDASRLVRISPVAGAPVDPDSPVTVVAVHGRLTDVTVTGRDGRGVDGTLTRDGRRWRSTGALEPGARYTVRIGAEDGRGGHGETTAVFTTRRAAALLTAQLGPGGPSGAQAVYGMGEPVTAVLSAPVHDVAGRAVVERALRVTSRPAVVGAWHWVDDRTLHFRPRHYWPAHSHVRVVFDARGTRIRRGLYGGTPSRTAFATGDQVEALIDARSDRMTYSRDGTVVRTFPVTTGKPGFATRNGVKVVLGREAVVHMDSDTVGIAAGSSESYSLDVYWATRVTWSGEYVHAAPWSVAAQGRANVSHGCTGLSTPDARWFFHHVRLGDVVRVVGSLGHPMEPFGNGFGDWNVPWTAWVAGSALHRAVSTAGPGGEAAVSAGQGLLRPEL